MPDRTHDDPGRVSTPAQTLPTRTPGPTYRPAATAFDEPQPSRPTRPFGAPDIGTDTITSNPTDGDDL